MPSTLHADERRERQHGSRGLAGRAAGGGPIAASRCELIALEKEGSLALTKGASQGLDVRLQVACLKHCLDTHDAAPTKLYARDHASIVVLDA
jgi:hypothetical protein